MNCSAGRMHGTAYKAAHQSGLAAQRDLIFWRGRTQFARKRKRGLLRADCRIQVNAHASEFGVFERDDMAKAPQGRLRRLRAFAGLRRLPATRDKIELARRRARAERPDELQRRGDHGGLASQDILRLRGCATIQSA